MSPRLLEVHPVLGVRDVASALRFYARLGFSPTFTDDATAPRYAAIRREHVMLHLQWADESQWAHPGDRPVCRFYVDDVDALFAELHAAGATAPPGTSPWGAPGDTPWGTREFHLRDPDGNGLQFYRVLGDPRGAPTVRTVVPFLHAVDVARAAAFYAHLGFVRGNSITAADGALQWAWLQSRDAALMLARASGPVPADQQAAMLYVYTEDTAAMRAHLVAAGIACSAISTPPWAPRGEFRTTDPDGYTVMVMHTR